MITDLSLTSIRSAMDSLRPSTLAAMVADLEASGERSRTEEALRIMAIDALVSNVGRAEAIRMISEAADA